MTREEKDLLVKDLCARLLYGVEIICEASPRSLTLSAHMLDEIIKDGNELQWKPYLRPMSSMTKEERLVYEQRLHDVGRSIDVIDADDVVSHIDWLYAHYLDFRGLIPMGLALEAPKDMYKIV